MLEVLPGKVAGQGRSSTCREVPERHSDTVMAHGADAQGRSRTRAGPPGRSRALGCKVTAG